LKPILIYAPGYDFSLFGLERLHPFDGHKFSRAWAILRRHLGAELAHYWQEPPAPVADADLLRVHTSNYLESLASPAVVARALELRLLKYLPREMIRQRLLRPMRLAAAGTMLATRHALSGDGAMAMNIGGGFHHAFRDHGEGFCVYADVAVAIAAARAEGALTASDPIAIIDLDAHRGNGVWAIHDGDPAVHIFDIYNFQIYPGLFPGDVEDFPFQIPIKAFTNDDAYLAVVREELPSFLASMPRPRLAIYNAGTDIVSGDRLGRLAVSPEGVATRDELIVKTLTERAIPTVIVTSGGYSERSHELIARLALTVTGRL